MKVVLHNFVINDLSLRASCCKKPLAENVATSGASCTPQISPRAVKVVGILGESKLKTLVMKTGVIILRTIYYLGGGFKYVLFSPLLVEMIQFKNLT